MTITPIVAYELMGTNCLFVNPANPDEGVPSLFDLYATLGAGIIKEAIDGTSIGSAATTTGYMLSGLHPSLVTYKLVPYPAAAIPMNISTITGVNNGIEMINDTPGRFVLFGWSQGAQVVSFIKDQIQGVATSQTAYFNDLDTDRTADFLGGATFGNPRREEGHSFPLGLDPPGVGALYPNLLVDTEDSWFDFVNTADPLATADPDVARGQVTIMGMAIINQTEGVTEDQLAELIARPVATVIGTLLGLFDMITGALGPHLEYGTSTPLSPADVRVAADIALDYFHSLALGWDAATVPPVATAVGSGHAEVEVNVPSEAGTYTYTIKAYDSTAAARSTPTVSGTVVGGGTATCTVTGLTVGHHYTFAAVLHTSYTSPTVAPASMMSNSVVIT